MSNAGLLSEKPHMADGITLFVVILLIYVSLLTVQKARQKSSWGRLFQKGDTWFVINLSISVVVAIPVSRSITKFFM